MWGSGLLLCWLDGDVRKGVSVVTMYNVSVLSSNGILQEMTLDWVESIYNEVLKKFDHICTNESMNQT